MAIKTIITCDRCGFQQERIADSVKEYFSVGVYCARLGTANIDVSDRTTWCNACCIYVGLIKNPKSSNVTPLQEKIQEIRNTIED